MITIQHNWTPLATSAAQCLWSPSTERCRWCVPEDTQTHLASCYSDQACTGKTCKQNIINCIVIIPTCTTWIYVHQQYVAFTCIVRVYSQTHTHIHRYMQTKPRHEEQGSPIQSKAPLARRITSLRAVKKPAVLRISLLDPRPVTSYHCLSFGVPHTHTYTCVCTYR